MATTIKEERLRWILPIVKKEMKLTDMARVCPHGKRSLERWMAAYKAGGAESLVPHSTRPKTQPGETPIHIKEHVIALRKQTKLCALKLHWRLAKQGIHLHERTVGKIIKAEGLVRTYHRRKTKVKYLKVKLAPGELMEIDVKYVPGKVAGRAYFQYTAIDCASRWRFLDVHDAPSPANTVAFLREVMKRFPYPITAVKTDNGPEFTNFYLGTRNRSDMSVKTLHVLDRFCSAQGIAHYLIDRGKPAQNGAVERSHREDQEKFYEQNVFPSLQSLQKKMRKWNMYYNNLEHCGLEGKTPKEFLAHYSKANPPYVGT